MNPYQYYVVVLFTFSCMRSVTIICIIDNREHFIYIIYLIILISVITVINISNTNYQQFQLI